MDSSKYTFEKWTPIDNLGNAYDVDEISWGEEGISFTLVSEGKKMNPEHLQKFRFIWDSSHMISYHVTDETYRADCWKLDFEKDGRFYISKESEYIDRMKKKSPLLPDDVIHFVIVGTNTIIDILAKEYPVVKISE